MPRKRFAGSLGLPAIATGGEAGARLPLSVDLAEWVRVSRRPLGTLLADLARLGTLEDARLELGQVRPGDEAARRPDRPARPAADRALSGGRRAPAPAARSGIGLSSRRAAAIASPAAAAPPPAPGRNPQPAAAGPAPAARALAPEHDKTASLRINVELLDRLMTLTSELTLIRNQSAAGVRPGRRPAAADRAAPRRGHLRAPGDGAADPDATDRQPVREVPAGGSRPRKAARKTGGDDGRRPGGRARQDDPRATLRPAHPPGPQQRRPRHRGPRGTGRERQARGRADHPHGGPRGRPGPHRDPRRRAGHRPPGRPRQGAGHAAEDGIRARPDVAAGAARLDPAARLLDRPAGLRGVRPRGRHGRGQDEHRAPRRVADDRLAARASARR